MVPAIILLLSLQNGDNRSLHRMFLLSAAHCGHTGCRQLRLGVRGEPCAGPQAEWSAVLRAGQRQGELACRCFAAAAPELGLSLMGDSDAPGQALFWGHPLPCLVRRGTSETLVRLPQSFCHIHSPEEN